MKLPTKQSLWTVWQVLTDPEMLHFDVLIWACTNGSCLFLHLNCSKAGKAAIPTSIIFLTKPVHSRTYSWVFKSLFSVEKLNLLRTCGQWCQLEETPLKSRGKLPFVHMVSSEMSEIAHNKNGQVSEFPAWFTAIVLKQIVQNCILFLFLLIFLFFSFFGL